MRRKATLWIWDQKTHSLTDENVLRRRKCLVSASAEKIRTKKTRLDFVPGGDMFSGIEAVEIILQ